MFNINSYFNSARNLVDDYIIEPLTVPNPFFEPISNFLSGAKEKLNATFNPAVEGSWTDRIGDAIGERFTDARNVLDLYRDTLSDDGKVSRVPSTSAKDLDYYAADLAKRYGMSKDTAYSEALQNTAYQRAVADMRQAGLNPSVLFSSGRGQPSGSNVVINSRASGGSSSNEHKIDGSVYYGVTAAAQVLGVLLGGPRSGNIAGTIASNIMKSINGS